MPRKAKGSSQAAKKSAAADKKKTTKRGASPASSCSRSPAADSSCSKPKGSVRKHAKKGSSPNSEASCTSCSTPSGPKTEEIGDPVIKSPLDAHGYKMVKLAQNGLQGLLISTCLHDLDEELTSKRKQETCIFGKIAEFNEAHCNFQTQTGLPGSNSSVVRFSKASLQQKKKLEKREKERDAKKKKLDRQRQQYLRCEQGIHEQDDEMEKFCKQKCVAALYIKAGFFQDPPEIQGMAHFCEHAISLGSKNFPEVEAFSKFVDQNGGLYNARTEEEGTCYYFYVDREEIEQALIMFVDMFANPIFASGDKIAKEVDNLNSEFEIKRQNDELRHAALLKSLVPDGHPISNFGMGSYDTIHRKNPIDLRDRLISWISRYYCSENMIFCIQAPKSIHELEGLFGEFCCKFPTRCDPIYKNVPSKSLKSETTQNVVTSTSSSSPMPFEMEKWNKLYYMEALGSTAYMTVTWTLDPKYGKNFKTKPVQYLNYILNWKETGSLGWYLKDKGWITNLSVNTIQYPSIYTSEYYTWFLINLELTTCGLEERMKVLKIVFQYIKLIQENGASEMIFNEIRQLQSDIFHYRSDMNLSDPTIGRKFDDRGISETIQTMLYTLSKTDTPADVLLNTFLLREYNPQLLEEFINQLTPKTANVIFASKDFAKDANQKEKWYKTNYFTKPMCRTFLVDVEKSPRPTELSFPRRNRFLEVSFCYPDLEVGKDKMERKKDLLMYESEKGEIFYGNEKCRKGLLPSSQFTFDFYSPPLQDDVSLYNAPSVDLLVLTLKYVLDSVLATALSSLISCEVEGVTGNVRVVLSGPSPKLPFLAKIIMTTVQMLDVHVVKKPGMVEDLKRTVMSTYHTCLNESESIAYNILNYVLSRRSNFISDYLGVLQNAYGFNDFLSFVKEFKFHQFVSGYLDGCVTRRQASDIAKNLDLLVYSPYKMKDGKNPIDNAIHLPRGERCILVIPRTKENRVSTVLNYYQIGPVTDRETKNILSAISFYLGESVFEELRTIQSLGYDAVSTTYDVAGVVGIIVFVQGVADKHTTGYINEEIDEFLRKSFTKCLSTAAKFKSQILPFAKEGVEKQYKAAKNFYQSHFIETGANFRKLSIQVQGFKKSPKSQPLPPRRVEEKVKMYRSGRKLESCGSGNDINGGSCGISRHSKYITLCMKDVTEENGYFITDVQKFKDRSDCFPNLEHLVPDSDDDDA